MAASTWPATVPGSSSAMLILPGQHNKLTPDTTLKFSRTGHPVEIQGMTGFVSEVEFADGKVWVPSREEIQASPLFRIIPASSEEQRLADIYSTRGLGRPRRGTKQVLTLLSAARSIFRTVTPEAAAALIMSVVISDVQTRVPHPDNRSVGQRGARTVSAKVCGLPWRGCRRHRSWPRARR